ncbi:low-density lipo receptor-related 2-like protein [Labeo rohita]|uniref:Low-density lipo receptor-related 2-like protein n=1 Tax=Labeo rohita TaxID=84645 RepID=A0A498NDL3_LABRO|nr:low-density lipo receptor-related 2-like protein [Labeo rohita]
MTLSANGLDCEGAVTKILTTRKGLIGLVNVKTRVFEPLLMSESDPITMTYDIQRNFIFWADKDGNIYKAFNRKSVILYSGQSGLHSLAIDWLTGQLYWTSVSQKAIYTGAADGSAVSMVMSKEIDPSDMVLSPVESFIFWINKGPNEEITIERAEMDGLNRTTLVFITAQLPRSLTLDVAARRLYWISVYKASIESIRTDGTGRHTFWDFFQGRPAQTLAVFNGWFYFADEKKLWRAPQNMPADTQNGFILKATLPVLNIFHVLQQPQGFAPCKDSGCKLCLPSKESAAGFTCLCPEGALPMPWGSCENFKVAYATATAIYSLEFAGKTPVRTEIFTSSEDIRSFDMYWRRGCVVWSNGTGHVKTNIQSQDLSEYILTLKPACMVRVDQRTGNLYWLACDELSIGVSTIGPLDQSLSRQLYQAKTAILDLFVDWQRGKLYWLEGGQIMRMKLGLIGGNAEAIFSFEESGVDRIVFDRKANGFLWSMESYLQVMSVLKMRKYSAGKNWIVPGSIMAAYEPYMVTLFNNVLTVWNRKDGARVSGVAVENGVVGLSVALTEVQTGDFLCQDGSKCVERDQVCDGHSHCIDGSDEMGCPTMAPETIPVPLRCNIGSKPCKDGRECVLYSHVCDGEMDCKDGSDEQDCEYQCGEDQFQCAHGRMCIDRKQVCDGTPQCQDRSDELDCFTRSHECKHQCDNKTRCIPESFLCDGEKDCVDATDEINCCDFLCEDRRKCIEGALVCDGRFDCADGSDEMGCPTMAPETIPVPLRCNMGSKPCKDGLKCVLYSHVCDGEMDCKDGSDEQDCEYQCKEDQFQCAHGRMCIDRKQVCDGTPQCQDRSDELDCFTRSHECKHQCDDKTRCIPESFLCDGEKDCVDATDEVNCFRLCDGKIDCPDGSDEVSCVDTCSKPGDFLCRDRRKCIDGNLVCDGRSHCLDGSDEVTCYMVAQNSKPAPLKCRMGSKPCKNGRECVLYSHVCDGEKDCKDGSDERNCEYQCKADQFQCAHGRMCIDRKQVCDGTPQCQDRSDELDCFTRSHECKHQCDNKTRCIPESFLCDGEKDCVDATDEVNCCDFLCKDRRKCIDGNLVCDGRSHCLDGSDEVACYMAARTSSTASLKCRVGSKPCKDGRECVQYSHVCDGEMDCKDGSDEQDCGRQCQPGQFQCSSGGRCIEMNQVCDGTTQCLDKSDEAGCWKPSKSCSLRCDWDTHCIPEVFICNGIRDCRDGTDEANCGDFLCEDRRKCIEGALVCDGRSHCLDGSDEMGCPTTATETTTTAPFKCRVGSKPCKDGRECVLYSHVCDGEMDCKDGSDEEQCELQCNPGMFQCIQGKKCIDFRQVCDGTPQCPDHSDESGCWKPTKSCSIRCDGNSRCIPEVFICNGMRDCWDGSDEADCGDFMCKDRMKCIKRDLVCDGRSHCLDRSDEMGCPTTAPKTTTTVQLKCRVGSKPCKDGREFQCAHGRKCIDSKQVCDGKPQCQDFSDESDCFIRSKSCSHRCDNKTRCIPENFLCDGEKDCVDGTDESDCGYPTKVVKCESPAVLCRDGSLCIPHTKLCDGKRDCPDGYDETFCFDRCPNSGDFLCKDRRKCVERDQLCDGRSHCIDGSDEVGCPTSATKTSTSAPLKCKMGSKPCKDGLECVLYSHVCDGEMDCKDGSDEQDCEYKCKEDQFQCAHGRMCIDRKQVCDGTPQCQDRSDELDCFTRSHECKHQCDDRTRCIPESFLCDGEKDCVDATDEVNCGQFLCKDRQKCVERALLCDGQPHCADGSDEKQCPTCALLCDQKRVCLTSQQLCDGKPDCRDGSDEKNCYTGLVAASASLPLKCPLGSKPCRDGKDCVLYSHVCDGEKDCKDGSDERNCERKCKKGQFQCAHARKCIDMKLVCDGTAQCQDRSDEINCMKLSEECRHPCDNKTRCVPETFLCDGERDCADGTDEANCVVEPCSSDRFQCSNGQCVALALRCDGYADCRDHSDEKGCAQPPHCPVEQRCPHTHECLLKEWLCDGDLDCSDGADERLLVWCLCDLFSVFCLVFVACYWCSVWCFVHVNCKLTPLKCGEFQWSCASKTQCIMTTWRCDGVKDCKDESDESGCGQVKCPTHLFRCGSGECVDPDLVCNRASDCADGSDEGVGCLKNNCSSPSSPSCQHYCINTPHGARCGCKIGFRLQSDGLTCNDIDECKEIQPDACSHKCLNTLGSYLCQCHPEFILEPDGRSCKTAEEPSLLVSEQYELLNLGLRRSSIQALITPGRKPIFSVDYDRKEQRVYWVSLEEERVKSDSIAIDWMGRNLYWVDGVAGKILAVRLTSSIVNPQNYIVVVDKDLQQPRSLVLLPQKGIMFWSEIGGQAQIECSGMDGSDRKVAVSRGLNRPVSVTVDVLTDRLYWTDEKLRCIGSATLDGENMRFLQLSEMPSPFSVAVFNDVVYWSDTRRRAIQGANKLTGKNRRVYLKRPGQPFDLKVVHPLLQPNVSSPCEKLRCSRVCLLTSGLKAVCRCPTGFLLAVDGFTCTPPVDSSSSFLMLLSPTVITQIFTKSLHSGVGLKTWPEHRSLSLPAVNEASDFDLLLKDHTISIADAGRGSVAQLELGSSGFTPIGHVLQLKGDLITALAVDWVTRNLYWSSVKSPQLYVTSAGGKYTSLVLQAEVEGTISIALHPPTGRLCFTAVGRRGPESLPQVDCAHMDGNNRTLLWGKAKMPASLAFSEKGTTLYWADIGNEVISSINMDGSNYKEYSTGSAFIVSFARVDNVYFWITLDNGTAKVWYTGGFQPKQMWFEVKANVIELKAYSRSSQKGTNACSENNGGCSHLCLPYPGGRSCRCALDYLTINQTKCVSNLKCPTGTKACKDGLKCISADKFCDKIPDCQDGSDEECDLMKIKPGVKSKSGPGTPQSTSNRLTPLGSAVDLSPSRVGSASCAAERCSGHGTCVSVAGESTCECEEGYGGDLCQNAASSSTALALTLTFLFGGALVAAVILKRRRAQAAREESTEKETLVTDVEERTTFTQNFANELYDPEESFGMSVPASDDDGLSRRLIACDAIICKYGRCVLVDEQPTCECKLGYIGETCNETINDALAVPLTLGILAVIIGFIILCFGLAFFRQKQKARKR